MVDAHTASHRRRRILWVATEETIVWAPEVAKLIEANATRLGLKSIKALSGDSRKLTERYEASSFDRILVDAPCSGLGVIRRKPEIKYKEYTNDMELLPKKQLAILSASSSYVKPGGTLVYSTCTINPRENEQVVETFLKRNRSFKMEEKTLLMPSTDKTDGFFICVMTRSENLI